MPDPTIVDLKPLLDVGLQLAAAVLLALGSWAVARLARKLKLDEDALVRGYLDTAMRNAVAYAIERARAAGSDVANVQIRNEVIRQAADYAVQQVPGAIKHFGLDGDAIHRMVTARLPESYPLIAALPTEAK